ncbi:polyphosphate kinase 2 family protein [Brachybacterium sp. NPDC056505]|uniref:polyphosphate kinase 2 family protein n=1 Tax=Brachybacterium sp. NPDC056505 TaxID=3345843 RepID=UPI003671AC1B
MAQAKKQQSPRPTKSAKQGGSAKSAKPARSGATATTSRGPAKASKTSKASKSSRDLRPVVLAPGSLPDDVPGGFPVPPGWAGDVHEFDPHATPGFDGGKKKGEKHLLACDDSLADLQERLFAAHHGAASGGRSVLLVVQGMDTSGKGGIMRHVVGAVDPQGISITAFKAPTEEEEQHDFLWRIRPHVPAAGQIGVFDRSHYEDVLIHRVHGWADAEEIERRYAAINAFEKEITDSGVTIVKVMLHVSYAEQGERLMERLERPDKHWKFNPGDIDERGYWSAYMDAYSKALSATSTPHAPWVVVPADRKWYARIAVQQLLLQALGEIDPQWPAADFDVAEQTARLRETFASQG